MKSNPAVGVEPRNQYFNKSSRGLLHRQVGHQRCWGTAGELSRKLLLSSDNNGSLESDKRCRDKANTATFSTCLLESVGGPKTRADVEMGKRC